jgi:hypothetical protein
VSVPASTPGPSPGPTRDPAPAPAPAPGPAPAPRLLLGLLLLLLLTFVFVMTIFLMTPQKFECLPTQYINEKGECTDCAFMHTCNGKTTSLDFGLSKLDISDQIISSATTLFNMDLSKRDISSATKIQSNMLHLSKWDISSVAEMPSNMLTMFWKSTSFNVDPSDWNFPSATDISPPTRVVG